MGSIPGKEVWKLYQKAIKSSNLPDRASEALEALVTSHSTKGQQYRLQGRLRKAIEEFLQDTQGGVLDGTEAMVAENAFCLMGDTFMELGETENAIAAYEKALELWRQYGYGSAPHISLAEAYLTQGRTTEAISICEEMPEESRGWGVRRVLEEAKRRKSEGNE